MNEMQEGRAPKESRGGKPVNREAQGDLLADAMTGLFSREVSEDSLPESEEGAPAPEVEPEEPTSGEEIRADAGDASGSPEEPIPDSPWEQKMAWAKRRFREGRLKEAEELYRELVREAPESVRALNNLGVLLDEKGDPEEAVIHLRAAKRLDPHNQEVLGNLGVALGAMGQYAEAEQELRHAVRLNPANLEVRANLGILLFRRGMYEHAAAELAHVCAGKPEDGAPFFYRGEALNRLGRVDEAIEALQRVTELWPTNPKAFFTLGVLFDKKTQPEQAAAMYRKARALSTP
jgi:Flp pilus assembly protein TadD